MIGRDPWWRRGLAIGLAVILCGIFPVWGAGERPTELTGSIVSSESRASIEGARLYVGQPTTGKIYTSEPSASDGSFELAGVPAGTYELAVQVEDALYVISAPLTISPGRTRPLNISVNEGNTAAPPPGQGAARSSFWNNPLTAALTVVGVAFVIGWAVSEADDDDPEAPSSPFALP